MYTLVSPWPPVRNGIADYAWQIAAHSSAPMRIVTRGINPQTAPAGCQLLADTTPAAAAALQDGPNVFHFGNNPDHVFAVAPFLRFGGWAVVHDASLHHLCEWAELSIPGLFATVLRESCGPGLDADADADALQAGWRAMGARRMIDHRELPMLSWLKDAQGIIVHSRFAARIVAGCLPHVPVHVIPHFAYPPQVAWGQIGRMRVAARARLGLPPELFVLAALGFAKASKQYAAIMRGIQLLPPADRRRCRFIIAGGLRPAEYDLSRDIAALGAGDFTESTGFVDDARMRDILLASDLAFNLRYPTLGESSGSLARAIGLGCGIAVSDGGAYAELPQDICFRLPAKPDPSREVAGLLRRLLDDRGLLDTRRKAAYLHGRLDISPSHTAAAYQSLIHG